MNELNKLGKVLTTDVLVIGAGLGGMLTALKLKKLDKSIDVLCIEKNYHGYTGQSTKAGHGFFYMSPKDDIDEFCKQQIEINNLGMYLNDQEYMYETVREGYTYVDELQKLGGVFAHNEDGSLYYHKEFDAKKSSGINTDLDDNVAYTNEALKNGVRIMERMYFTDLLTEGGRVIGAVGFHLDTLEFHIFRAKAVVLAANAFSPCVSAMFYTPATPTIAAYEAGAQLRNAEQATYCDLCRRNTKDDIYGAMGIIFNKKGENLFQKYNSQDFENIDIALMRGMYNEVKEGNYPLYVDFSKLPKMETGETEGEGFHMGMIMPLRVEMNEELSGGDANYHINPEVSVGMYVYSESLRVDIDTKTTIPNLYGVGTIGMYGSAYGGWVHGEGVGYACRTGLRAARTIAPVIADIELGEVSTEQVKAFKERIYAPFTFKGKDLPFQIVHYLDRLVMSPENSLFRTEESIHNVLNILKEMRDNLESSIYVPEGDGHHLAKAIEARAAIDMLEIMYMAYDTRKESRGFHTRVDYPERDDKNWLKWIVVNKGEDGSPNLTFERIPFERYKWKPEGWTPDSIPAE